MFSLSKVVLRRTQILGLGACSAAVYSKDDIIISFDTKSDLPEEEDDGFLEETIEKKPSEEGLFKTIVSAAAAGLSVGSALDKWVEEEGNNEINRVEVDEAMLGLRRRGMYGRALQMSEWLEANKKIEMNERDYACRLDLTVKVHGLEKGEAYMEEKIPKSFKGEEEEVIYRTLLANCVDACNVKKSELVFNKMRNDLGFPLSAFTCDQMLLLYNQRNESIDMEKMDDVLWLMGEENVNPSLLTYKILIDVIGGRRNCGFTIYQKTKGATKFIRRMEEIVEIMKDEGVEPDFQTLAITARHHLAAGREEKAQKVLEEMGGAESLEAYCRRRFLTIRRPNSTFQNLFSPLWTMSSFPILQSSLPQKIVIHKHA